MTGIARAIDAPEIGLPLPGFAKLCWQRLLGWGLSFLLLGALALALRREGLGHLREALPSSPFFWFAFAVYYFALPASEWIIYHRIWNLPGAGFVALLRKLISNEMLLGYSGELSFYLYARREAGLKTSPFKAIKDVSILSALTGNIATLGMIALAYPIWRSWGARHLPSGTGISILLLCALSVILIGLRSRIFSLSVPELRFIAASHALRILTTTLLLGMMWTTALPLVPLNLWLGLAALQLVVTRLPLVPNKDIVFAGSAILIVGAHTPVATLMALVASLLVITHLIVGLTLVARDVIGGALAS